MQRHDDRLKKKCFDSWAQYEHAFEIAKNACKRMICRGDQGRERRAFLKWIQFCKLDRQEFKEGAKEKLMASV